LKRSSHIKILESVQCVLDALTVDAYQKNARIADRKVNVQIVVGKIVVAGIILINQ